MASPYLPRVRARLADASRARVDVHLTPADRREALRRDALEGLTASPKELQPKWLYDARGSALFEAITRLPEYYLTRREREILRAHAREITSTADADTLVELGSGSSAKTRLLLDAMAATGRLRRFVPFDTSESALRESVAAVAEEYREIEVHGLVGDFERHVNVLPDAGSRLIVFLGSTIGNFPPAARAGFLGAVAATMAESDAFLLGTDLVKDPDRLLAAYDDVAGVTAAFNRNILWVLNRELRATFLPHRFEHVARWDEENEWMEMRLRSAGEHVVHVRDLAIDVAFAAGEEMRTEISAKFRRNGVEAELEAAGLRVVRWWTDPREDFALSLSVRS